MSQRSDLDFKIDVSRRYCQYRHGFLVLMARLCLFTNIFAGTAAFSSLLPQFPGYVAYAGLIVALISLVDLVFEFSRGAQRYDEQYRRYTDLQREIIADVSGENIVDLMSKYHEIELDDPPPKQVLTMICYNEAISARGTDTSERRHISFIRRLCANLWDMPPAKWELETRPSSKDKGDSSMMGSNADLELRKTELRVSLFNAQSEAVIGFASLAIKSMILAHTAAAGAVLTFVAAMWSDPARLTILESVGTLLFLFAIGATAGILCACFSYLAQYCYSVISIDEREGSPQQHRWYRIGTTFHLIALMSAAGSVFLFPYAAWNGLSLLQNIH